jgi:predicted nucleic acid-binding Zn ribbon protein
LTELLSDVLKRGALASLVRNGKLILLWESAVSDEISKQTEAVNVFRRILYVNVKSSVWAQELRFLKGEIVNKINKLAGYKAIIDIQFKAGG